MELPAPNEISNINNNAMKSPSAYDDPFGDMSSPLPAATTTTTTTTSSDDKPPSEMNPFALTGNPWSSSNPPTTPTMTTTTTTTATTSSDDVVDESTDNSNDSTPLTSNTTTTSSKTEDKTTTGSGDDDNDNMALLGDYTNNNNNSNHSGNNNEVPTDDIYQTIGEFSINNSNHSYNNNSSNHDDAANQLLGEYNNNNNNDGSGGNEQPTPLSTSDHLLGEYSSQTTPTTTQPPPPLDPMTTSSNNMTIDAYDPGPALFGGPAVVPNLTDDATETSEDFRAGYVASINQGMTTTTTGTTDGGVGSGSEHETDKNTATTAAAAADAAKKVGAVSVTLDELGEVGEKERQFTNEKAGGAAGSTIVEEKTEEISTTNDKDITTTDPFSLPLITPNTTTTTTEKEPETEPPLPMAKQRSVRFAIPDKSSSYPDDNNDPSLAPMVIPSTTKQPRTSPDDADEDVESKKGLLVPSGSADAASSPAGGGGSSNDAGNKKTKTLCITFIVIFSLIIAGGVVFLFVYWIPKNKSTPDTGDVVNETEVALNNSRTTAFDAIKTQSPTTILPSSMTFDELPAMAALANATAQLKAANWKVYLDLYNELPDATDARFLPRYALATLYYATYSSASSPWTNATNWLSNEDECTWYGLTCHTNDATDTTTNPHILTELKLPFNNLIGSIPPEIGLLTNLTDFVVTKNNLTGLPPWDVLLTQLTTLELLDLRENELEGTLSQLDFKTLTKLEDLLLSHNNLGGDVPQNTMLPSSLETFNFDNNNMTGAIPDIFCKEFQFTADCLNDTPINCTCCDLNSTMYRCV